jgi:HAD superfamily hydrolase (TIGR01458 family)
MEMRGGTALAQEKASTAAVRGILMDLGGVVYVGSTPIAGALAEVDRIRELGLKLRFITNTTQRSRRQVLGDLRRMGMTVADHELLTPALLARDYLTSHALNPILLVHPDLEEDFAGLAKTGRDAVVVGDAGRHFTYDRLNDAYHRILSGAPLLALGKNRNFKDGDGELRLDAGPFVTALEYASRKEAILLGKPSEQFFKLAIDGLGCKRSAIVMIGDDAEADVGGAIAAGIRGVLVRTGKYQPGDEAALTSAPHYIADTLGDAVSWILGQHAASR